MISIAGFKESSTLLQHVSSLFIGSWGEYETKESKSEPSVRESRNQVHARGNVIVNSFKTSTVLLGQASKANCGQQGQSRKKIHVVNIHFV